MQTQIPMCALLLSLFFGSPVSASPDHKEKNDTKFIVPYKENFLLKKEKAPKNSSSKDVEEKFQTRRVSLSLVPCNADTEIWVTKNQTLQIRTDAKEDSFQLQSNLIYIEKDTRFKIKYEIKLKKGAIGIGFLPKERHKWVLLKQHKTPGTIRGVIQAPPGVSLNEFYLVFINLAKTPSSFEILSLQLNQTLEKENNPSHETYNPGGSSFYEKGKAFFRKFLYSPDL